MYFSWGPGDGKQCVGKRQALARPVVDPQQPAGFFPPSSRWAFMPLHFPALGVSGGAGIRGVILTFSERVL